jgi:glycosyltransferase involved in cell wall biosynthesis
MDISVVIPTCRRPQLLLRCLEALCNQAFEKERYEIIVVSDGPDPITRNVLDMFLKDRQINLRFIQLPAKKGPAAARNAGWRHAESDLIAFTDDDCIPDKNWLKNFYEGSEHTAFNEFAFTGSTTVPIPAVPTDYELNISHLATAEFITANCACSKKALFKTGGFDEAFTMAWREDSDLQFKFIQHRIPIVPIPTAVVTHPVRKATWGVSLKEEKKGIFNALLYKKFPDLYRQKIQRRPPWLYYSILAFFIIFLAGVAADSNFATIAGLSGWFFQTGWFILKRLKCTSRSINHVLEMVLTSLAIPFLSLYWRWYGAVKYKTLMI